MVSKEVTVAACTDDLDTLFFWNNCRKNFRRVVTELITMSFNVCYERNNRFKL